MSARLSLDLEAKLVRLGQALIDQQSARVIIEPHARSAGFWFGGGNMIDVDGDWYVVGRYRNHGDSRTGLHAGERGLELAIFKSSNAGASWEKVVARSKSSLNVGDRDVLSIEGAALRSTDGGVELFVSTEKTNIGYPAGLEDYLKPGTGVWTIERLVADDVLGLTSSNAETIVQTTEPQFLHNKDPFVYDRADGSTMLLYCTHPFSWSSSNTAYVTRATSSDVFSSPDYTFFPRGTTWDVAMTRGTAVVRVPRTGAFADVDAALVFYDGGECLRDLDEHRAAVKRPRGYSCEEIGGLAYTVNDNFDDVHRLSVTEPLFISPYGTGCSRYVDVMSTDDALIATWQQSQDDLSQPLVMNCLSDEEIKRLLE